MESRDAAGPQGLDGLRIDLLRQAVAIYLAEAYAGAEPPEVVRKRLIWPEGVDAAKLLGHPPFERATKPGTGRPTVYALRLGNLRYPHMKLQVQPWPNPAGFLLSVNTHDQVVAIDPNSSDAEAFRALQAENQRLKEAIELAWDRAGLPTFLRYLRDYIETHTGAAQAGAEQR
jgi:hypothetical protein